MPPPQGVRHIEGSGGGGGVKLGKDGHYYKQVSEEEFALNQAMHEAGIGPAVEMIDPVWMRMDNVEGQTLEQAFPEGTRIPDEVVRQMDDIFRTAASKGWRLYDNNPSNFIWDGKKLSRIDFDARHTTRTSGDVDEDAEVANMHQEAVNTFDLLDLELGEVDSDSEDNDPSAAARQRAREYVVAQNTASITTTVPRVVTSACDSHVPHYLTYVTEQELALILHLTAESADGVMGPGGLICAPPETRGQQRSEYATVGQEYVRADPARAEYEARRAGRQRMYDDDFPLVVHETPPSDAELHRMWRAANGVTTSAAEDAHWLRDRRFRRLRMAVRHIPHPQTRETSPNPSFDLKLVKAPKSTTIKVTELREQLEARGLDAKGQKAALVDRLLEDIKNRKENAEYVEWIRDELAPEPHYHQVGGEQAARIARSKSMTQSQLATEIERRYIREAVRSWWLEWKRFQLGLEAADPSSSESDGESESEEAFERRGARMEKRARLERGRTPPPHVD